MFRGHNLFVDQSGSRVEDMLALVPLRAVGLAFGCHSDTMSDRETRLYQGLLHSCPCSC